MRTKMIFQVLYVICCVCLTWEFFRRSSKKSMLPPELSGRWPLIGHAWKMVGDRKHAFNMIKTVSKEVLEKGSLVTVYVGPQMVYVTSDPDDCATIANTCLGKDDYYLIAKPFLGNGLAIADLPRWKQNRKNISPAFRQQILNNFLVVFNYQSKRLVSQFKAELGKGPFNHETYIRLNSLESICMTAFGADTAEFGGLLKQYMYGLNEVLEIFTERFQKFWLHSDFIYNRSNLKTRQDAAVKNIQEFTRYILEKKKTEMKENSDSFYKSAQYSPFMNLILELSTQIDGYSDEDILYETNSIVGGGYDTSASVHTMVLILLGSYPEVQKKVQMELQEVFDNSDRDVKKEDLPKLVYLEAVCKETLRLYPVAVVVARCVVKDVKLKNYTLKAGHGVAMLFWAMHRHKVWGPDAEEFRPERWLDGSLPTNPNAFAGFSIGKRDCIGKTYAVMSLKTVLSHVLRRYSITSDISKVELEIGTLLRIASGQNITIEERILKSVENKQE